jgi:hypothetical protein
VVDGRKDMTKLIGGFLLLLLPPPHPPPPPPRNLNFSSLLVALFTVIVEIMIHQTITVFVLHKMTDAEDLQFQIEGGV